MKKIALIAIALLAPSLASAATLSVSPSSQSVTAGGTFTVTVNLDTQNASIDGVDLRYLNFNSALLEVQDANSGTAGVQIAPGSLMPLTLANTVDNSLGRITFSQVSAGGSKYRGSGVLATITFRAKAAGTASVSFNYTSGNTTDSNVAAAGADALSAVINGSYTINSSSSGGGSSSTGSGSSSGGGGGSVTVGGSTGSGSSSGGAFSPSVGGSIAYGGGSGCLPGLPIPQINSVIGFGSRGESVTNLQKFLVEMNYTTADNITGYFGPATQAALQKFQAAQGIVSSGDPVSTGYGNAGPSTRARINSLIATSVPKNCAGQIASAPTGYAGALLNRALGRGSSGSDVSVLQNFLVSQGFMTADNATGYFGPITEAAVQKFQAAQGIVSSGSPITTGYGNVGPSTRARINAMLGSSGAAPSGTSGSPALQTQIEELQRQVNELLLKLQNAQ